MTDTLTIRGFVGNDPQTATTTGGVPVLNFRVASSQRRYDSRTQTWIDMGTNWYSVSAYRQLAEHARASLRKGDAVIVSGRLKLREWESAGGQRGSSFDLDADTIGHDLRWGTSNFLKSRRPVSAVNAPYDHGADQHPGDDPYGHEDGGEDGDRSADAGVADEGIADEGVADEGDLDPAEAERAFDALVDGSWEAQEREAS